MHKSKSESIPCWSMTSVMMQNKSFMSRIDMKLLNVKVFKKVDMKVQMKLFVYMNIKLKMPIFYYVIWALYFKQN